VVHETYQKADGGFATPDEVKVESGTEGRRASLLLTGEEVAIGPIEKMSKSKRNTVDPDDIIGTFGADTARWFMLSDSPPERDVVWTEEGVQGAWRFVQRLWRLIHELSEFSAGAPTAQPLVFSDSAMVVRKTAHRTLAKVSEHIEKLRFNVCIAHIYEFANSLQAVVASSPKAATPDIAFAVREAAEIMVQLFHPMMPHLAEECWAVLGHENLLAFQNWPILERDLLVEDTITLPVQVNGKKRADVTIARDAGNVDIEASVLALEAIKRALDGKPPRKVIIVPQRIINVVA